jgi:hypothetical protein
MGGKTGLYITPWSTAGYGEVLKIEVLKMDFNGHSRKWVDDADESRNERDVQGEAKPRVVEINAGGGICRD